MPRRKETTNLKAFRHAVSVLKKQGLISKRVDARSAYPSQKYGGRIKLGTIVQKFDDVVSGKVTAVKVPDVEKRSYQRVYGYQTVGDRVLVPHGAGEQVKVHEAGPYKDRIVVSEQSGIKRVQLPMDFHNLEQYLEDGIDRGEKLNKDMGVTGRSYFAFRIFGNQSWQVFRNAYQMLETLRGYESVKTAMDKSRRKQSDLLNNIEIVVMPKASMWEREERPSRWKPGKKRKRKPEDPFVAAERQRKWRATLTESQKADYNRKGRERARKSQEKRSPF